MTPFFVGLLLFNLINLDEANESNLPYISKSYSCVKGVCIPSTFQTNQKENNFFNGSLSICRMTCGYYGSLWPRPTIKSYIGKSVRDIGLENIKFNLSSIPDNVSKQYFTEVTQVFFSSLKKLCKPQCVSVSYGPIIYIQTSEPFDYIKLNTNESYELNITTKGGNTIVKITAPTVYGARNGLETLRQLIATYGSQSMGRILVIATDVHIIDKPQYSYRGFLLDTSRRYFSISAIKKTIDGMGHSKLNVFHWHATDTHSFPLDLPSVPQMSKYGAYSLEKKYSYSQIKNLLRYALIRGVRIIMEIDSPSHAGYGWQWGPSAGLGDMVVCLAKNPWTSYCVQPPCGQLNPINNNTYKWLGKIYKDLVSLFPKGEAFHMGADEVAINCWNSTSEIVDWVKINKKKLNEEAFFELWSEFQSRALKTYDDEVGDSNTDIIIWSSGLTNPKIIEKYLDKNRFTVEVWDGHITSELVSLGYKVIVAVEDIYYLDHGLRPTTNYHSWKVIYDEQIPVVQNKSLVLGAETCLWTEYVDESGLDIKVWPRAAALAERLWTDPTSSALSAEYRLLEHRNRLKAFGIRPETTLPEWCEDQEGECIINY